MIDLRLPNITGATEREQLQQIKSYLHQTVEQLNWALNNIDTQSNTAVVAPTARSLAPAPSGSVSQSDPQATFSSIKSLIIKSAEIVDAYYDEINAKLEGLYVAKSDFGTFVEETEANFEATSQGITQTYTSIQTLESAVGGIDTTVQTLGETVTLLDGTVTDLDTTVQTVDGKVDAVDGRVDTVVAEANTNLQEAREDILGNMADLAVAVGGHTTGIAKVQGEVEGLYGEIGGVKENVDKKTKELDEAIEATNAVVVKVIGTIKTGEIDQDDNGAPIYGLEVGQINTTNGKVIKRYARFTADKLSFYDANDNEVAWISNKQLHITDAVVKKTIDIGGYRIDTTNGLAFKWVGGN